MSDNAVVVLAGLPGAGKSTVVECFKNLGFDTKSGSDDVIQPHFVETVNVHKSTGEGEWADFPYYLSMTDQAPFDHLEPHEWQKLDYNLKTHLRPHITKHAWKMREGNPEEVAAQTMKILDTFPAAVDSARTEGDYTHYFDGPHQNIRTYLLEIVADEEVRIARIGAEAVAKGMLSTEQEMVRMLAIYRDSLARDGRYIRLENNYEDIKELEAAMRRDVLPKLTVD